MSFLLGIIPRDINANSKALLKAARQGNVAEVKRTLSMPDVDVNYTSKSMFGTVQPTALNIACSKGFTEVIAELIMAGADLNVRDQDGMAPIHNAAEIGCAPGVKLLLEAGVNVDERVQLPEEKRVHIPAPQTNSGRTPFLIAVLNGKPNTAEVLWSANPDVNAADDDGVTPLYVYAARGDLHFVSELINRGANMHIHPSNHPSNRESHLTEFSGQRDINGNGWSPLYAAVARGHIEVVDYLLQLPGADISCRTTRPGRCLFYATCMHYNMSNERLDAMIKLLIQHGGDINMTDQHGLTILHHIAMDRIRDGEQCDRDEYWNIRKEKLLILFGNGADASIRDEDGQQPVDKARRLRERWVYIPDSIVSMLQNRADELATTQRQSPNSSTVTAEVAIAEAVPTGVASPLSSSSTLLLVGTTPTCASHVNHHSTPVMVTSCSNNDTPPLTLESLYAEVQALRQQVGYLTIQIVERDQRDEGETDRLRHHRQTQQQTAGVSQDLSMSEENECRECEC